MKPRSPRILLATVLLVILSVVSSLPALAAGTNVANVVEYALYNYVDSNTVYPTPIGTVLTTGNDGANYNYPPPWTTLTGVPYVFSGDVRIGIKFAVNVIDDSCWSANQACFHMYDSGSKSVSINVTRAGDGSSADVNKDYIFIAPQGTLTPSATYKIIIDATLTSKNGNQAGKEQEITFTTMADTTDPTWPAGSVLNYDGVTPTGVTLNWTAATDDAEVTGYKIYQDATLVQTVSAPATSCSLTGLTPGTTYSFSVQAVDAAGNISIEGPTTSVTTTSDDQAPVWPVGSTLTISDPSDTGLTLTWPAAIDNLGVAGYKVYQDSVLIRSVSATTTSCIVSGLTAGTTYTFSVQAFDAAGNLSAGGPSISIKNGAPYNPGNVSLVLSPTIVKPGGDVTASGMAPADTWISLKVMNSDQAVVFFDGIKSDAGGNYNIAFKAPNTASGTLSVTVGFGYDVANSNLIVDADAPAWAGGAQLTAGNASYTSLTLTWPAATDNTEVAAYEIYQDGALIQSVNATTTSCQVTGLTAGTIYTFTIRVGDVAGNWSTGVLSATAGTVSDTIPPTWPEGSSITISSNNPTGPTLTWDAAADNLEVTGYTIWRDATLVATVDGNTLSWQATGLTAGTTYTFAVQAGDAAGNWSANGPSITLNPSTIGRYTITVDPDACYDHGQLADGINYMTVKDGVSGFKYFSVSITPSLQHLGDEVVVFVHLSSGMQKDINGTKADFDSVNAAKAGFNIDQGDVVKAFIVDDLTNSLGCNPIILQ